MCVYVCVGEVCSGAHSGQKRALASLELEFQAIVSCPVSDGKESSSGRAASAFNFWATSLTPNIWFHTSVLTAKPLVTSYVSTLPRQQKRTFLF